MEQIQKVRIHRSVGIFPTAVKCQSGQTGGDCAQNIQVGDRRCFYPVLDGTTCWQPPQKRDAGGGRVVDEGALTRDTKCAKGWSERTSGICTKDCTRYYRNYQTVGYGFSHKNCAECSESGVSSDDKTDETSTCRLNCSKIELKHCSDESRQASANACETPGSGCRWRANFDDIRLKHLVSDNGKNCIDPTVKIEHYDHGLLCQEKCGTEFDRGPGYLQTKNPKKKQELCDDKFECNQWQMQRCYKPCDADQIEVGIAGSAYLCRDSCERAIAAKKGSCAIKIKTKNGKEWIARPANPDFTGTTPVNLKTLDWVKEIVNPSTYTKEVVAVCDKIPDQTTCTTHALAKRPGVYGLTIRVCHPHPKRLPKSASKKRQRTI